MDQLATLVAAWGLLFPWALIGLRAFPGFGFCDRLLAGLVGGLAATVSLGYALAMGGWLDHYWIVYGLAWVVAVALLARGGVPEVRWPKGAGWIALVLGLVLLAEAVPLFSTEFPLGWDPTFHMILARKILEGHTLSADWRPFETIQVNYTQGLHVLIALVADWARQPPHIAFQMLHLVCQPLAGVLVLRLALVIFGDYRIGVLALVAYEFLCAHGSFASYYQWGGLPTELGSVFFLAVVWMGLYDRGRRGTALAVLCYGSLVMTHHLSGLIATWVLAFYWMASALGRTDGALRMWILRVWPLTAVVYAFYLVPYIADHVGNLGHTEALRFYDEDIMTGWIVAGSMGPVALVLGLVGVGRAARRPERPAEGFLLSWFSALMLGFALLGYAYRLGAALIYGEEFTAFTPSRFMTVAAYPLAIYAGYAMWRLSEVVATRVSRRPEAVMGAVIAAIALASVPGVVRLAGLSSVTAEGAALGRRIEAHVAANGFVLYEEPVLDRMQPFPWIPYLTWRRSVYTPIPASENRALVRLNREEMWKLKLSRIPQWVETAKIPIYYAAVDPETDEVEIRRLTEWEE